MRRTASGDTSGFSLFPFLAVLLCTMGAMVVLLVAMAYVSRAKAAREADLAAAAAEAARLADDSPRRREIEAKIAEAEKAAAELRRLKAAGADRLEQEQRRLSDIEEHIAKLQKEVEELVTETSELMAVEAEHYDDEKIAEQELERLNELVGKIQDDIEELKHAASGRERRYAIVPLRDERTGTLRPPVYYECDASGITLQPEGVAMVWQDLVAPQFSSPVAAASRAVTRYYEEHPEARAANEIGKPYPLLVVRPDGVTAYYQARLALEATGVDYGYQPVDADWALEYGEPNPVLQSAVEDSLRLARAEREGLARVIPKLASELANAERDAQLEMAYGGEGMSSVAQGGSSGPGLRVRPANPDSNNPFEGLRIDGTLADAGEPGAGNQPEGDPQQAISGPALLLRPEAKGEGVGGWQGGDETGPAGIAKTAMPQEPSQKPEEGELGQRYGGAPTKADMAGGSGAAAKVNKTPSASPALAIATNGPPGDPGAKGSSAEKANKGSPNREGVPMVRPIRVYVSRDRVVVLPDTAQSPSDALRAASSTHAVDFDGATTDHINDLIAVLKQHADSWGIAGDGMYWDPRLILNVSSDGAQRADDLRRLLEAAGLAVQSPAATAANPGGTDATRR